MISLSRWKVVEKPETRSDAAKTAAASLAAGAVGAVTSWGSGISHRETLRIYWDAGTEGLAEKLGSDLAHAEDVIEEDWRGHWRESLTPFRAGRRFLFLPAWETKGGGGDDLMIRIDPGMAFGAGDHPTTRLCAALLEELAELSKKPVPVLDVGAGTGILSIAAARLGLFPVVALDIDPFCYSSCKRNIRANNLTREVTTVLLSLDLLDGLFSLVIANVAPRQIEIMAPLLAEKVSTGGLLLLSGFQEDAEVRVARGFTPHFSTEARLTEEGWVALLLKKW